MSICDRILTSFRRGPLGIVRCIIPVPKSVADDKKRKREEEVRKRKRKKEKAETLRMEEEMRK
jgi:hypothetical protein